MVIADDKPGSAELRARVWPAHVAYLEARFDKLIAAGAKMTDDGVNAIGSLYVIDTDSRQEAENSSRTILS
jgi:uncharacterized protein YciI